MLDIIPSKHRHFSAVDRLRIHGLFSFARHFDPKNIQFSALFFFNDDIVEPKTGFATLSHQEMEITTG